MAVLVDISDTLHLAYSPLNEKHNVLYNKARHIFNQRFIQKPWFNLNPFIDEAVGKKKKTNLDTFVPDDFKGVQPLQSLCIVEDYFHDKPLVTKEFRIGEFWDFLFSSGWTEGYSIRVLEGHLHEMLVSILVQLLKTREVVQHSTLAYAKNRRPRMSVYKHSDKSNQEHELGCTEETLLLEFIYYGRAVNFAPEDSSVGYAGSSTTWPYVSSMSEDLESSESEFQDTMKISERLSQVRPPVGKAKHSKVQQKRFRKRVSYSDEQAQPETEVRSSVIEQTTGTASDKNQHLQSILRNTPKGLPTIQERGPAPKFRGIRRHETLSNFSSGSDYTYAPPSVDLKKFLCTEKVSYLGEFDLDSDSSSSESEEEEHFGQEFYLGDVKKPEFETVEEMLQRRKQAMKYIRAYRRREWDKRKMPKKSMLPELSKLDIQKYLSHTGLKMSDLQKENKVPDLEDYIRMLKEEEKFDPSLGSMEKQKFMKVALKYKLIKPENERFGDEVGGVTDSIPCKLHCYDMDPQWKTLADATKRNYLLKKLSLAGGKVVIKSKKRRKRQAKKSKPLTIPLVYITTISGISYLHPVSKPVLQKRLKEKAAAMGGRTPLTPVPTALQKELEKKKKSRTPSPIKEVGGADTDAAVKPGLMFPKAVPLVSGRESPDVVSDDESDELSDYPFDTNKLNITYSIEKIKRRRAKERAKENKAGKFYKVLQKYHRMQAVLKAFAPKPKRSRRLSFSGSPSAGLGALFKTKPKRKTLGSVLNEEEEVKEDIIVGKLKHFSFLDAKQKPQPVENTFPEEPLFDVYHMDDFKLNFERALEEFVVRREIVVSDISTKASASITFTRKSVFTKSKFTCN